MRQPLHGVVVQIDMRKLDRALERVGVDGEAVVLRRDFDLAGGQIFHRLIAAVMTELELVRPAAESEAQNLMPETNAEDRSFADQLLHVLFRIRYRIGIAWAVGKKNSIGIERKHVLRGRMRGHDLHGATGFGEAA